MKLPIAIVAVLCAAGSYAMPLGLRTAMWGAELDEAEAGKDVVTPVPSWTVAFNANGGMVEDRGLGIERVKNCPVDSF